MIAGLVIFFIFWVTDASKSSQLADLQSPLEELQEQILSIHRDPNKDRVIIVEKRRAARNPKKFLKEMALMGDFPFILYWYSYGNLIFVSDTDWCLFREITIQKNLEKSIFEAMKVNYSRYLNERVLKDLLSTNPEVSEAEKEELLSDAMALYYGMFRSIWIRLVKPGSEKFDDLQPTFTFYRKILYLGIYDSLDLIFSEMFRNINNPDDKLLFNYKKQFHMLVGVLSDYEIECGGLKWVADHKDPHFILSFFYYLRFLPTLDYTFIKKLRPTAETRAIDFEIVLGIIRRLMKFKFDLKGRQLIFYKDFKSPFPGDKLGNDAMISTIFKIISKARKFLIDHCESLELIIEGGQFESVEYYSKYPKESKIYK
jgi:hypothetical protein